MCVVCRHCSTPVSVGEREVVFVDHVKKVNSRNARQSRVMLLTRRSVCLLGNRDTKIHRRVKISDIKWVTLSRKNTHVMAVHHLFEHGTWKRGGVSL